MSMETPISCESCVGACCRTHTFMNLTDDEAAYLDQRGTKLKRHGLEESAIHFIDGIPDDDDTMPDQKLGDLSWEEKEQVYDEMARWMEARHFDAKIVKHVFGLADAAARQKSTYELKGDCANLNQETNQCMDYENRPEICRAFPVGSIACKEIRTSHFVDPTPVTLQPKADVIAARTIA